MRKLMTGFLVFMLACSAMGCSKQTDNNKETNQTESNSSAVTTTDSATNIDAEANTEKDDETKAEANDSVLEELKTKIMEAYGEDYTASDINLALFGDAYTTIEDLYQDRYGLSADIYDEIIAQMSMISAQSDEFVAVHAKEGQVAEVVKALTSYQETLKNDTMQYPSTQLKIQASQVVEKGDYVFFVMLGTPSMEAETDEQILASAKEQNQKAIDIIDQYFK